MSARVLLFGPNGQLGARLMQSLSGAGYDVTGVDRAACDLLAADQRKIDVAVRAVEPAIIINAAAYTAVDKAESDVTTAEKLNSMVPEWMAKSAAAHAIPFLHFSTDYVFDGAGNAPYRADAPPRPLNVYGRTKRAGEEAVRAAGGHVFRLQWVYDTRGKNFLMTMQTLLAQNTKLRMVADQIGAPSSAQAIAAAVAEAVPKILSGAIAPDIYHLTAAGYTSWHGFACAIAHLLNKPVLIEAITSAEYPLPATRPLDARLDCRALAAYGVTMPHWRETLTALLKENAA